MAEGSWLTAENFEYMTHMRRGWKIAMIAVFGTAALILFGLVTQSLWNWLVPVLFSGPVISFWQALGLLVLSKILFSGFGKGGGGHWKHRGPYGGYYWREKWGAMTPEERERLKQRMRDKWGCSPGEKMDKNTPATDSGISNG